MKTSHTPTDFRFAPEVRPLLLKLALVFGLAFIGCSAWAFQQNWAGPGGTTASPTSGIWDTNTPNWDAGVIFTNNNGAIFGGADGAYFIQVGTNFNATNITFTASGYTLTNDTPRTISIPPNNGSVIVATGKTNTIGTNITLSAGGNPFTFNPGATAGGTLIIDNGGTLQQQNNQPFNFDGTVGSTIRVLTGGMLRHAGNGSNIRFGITANSAPNLSIEGGSFVCTGGSSFGSIILSAANSSTTTVSIVSGMLSNAFTANAANGSLNIGNGSPCLATVNLNGGILALGNIRKTTAAATGILNLNGGTLKAATGSSGSTFLPALAGGTVNVRNNNSTIDNGGFAITDSQPLVHSAVGGDNATDGGLTFTGAGTTILAATNTYTGPTTVNTGSTLSLGTSGVINSSSAVAVNGTLSLSNRLFVNSAGSFSMTNGTLLLNSINFPTNVVTGILGTGGSANLLNFVAIVGPGSIPQSISIIKYTSLAAGVVDGGNNLTTLGIGALPPGFGGYLTNNVANQSIDLVVTQGVFQALFTSQPTSATRYKGYNVQFSATAIGATSYRWQTNSGSGWVNLNDGGNITGSTTNVLTITNLALSQSVSYQLLAINAAGTNTSSPATLTVLDTIGYGGTNALLGPLVYYRLNETGDPINTPNLPAFDFVGGIDGIYSTNALDGAYGIAGPQPPAFPGFESTNTAAELTRGYPGSWVAVSNSWPMNTNTVTLLAWVHPLDHQTNFAGIVVERGPSVASCGLSYSGATNSAGNNTLGYNWNNDGNAFGWDSGLVPPIGQWSLVALVVTPTNATIYLGNTNGLASSVHVLNHAVQSFVGPFFIGSDPFDISRTFNGDVDEVSAFNRALSQSEIFSLLATAVGTTNFPPSVNIQPPANIANFQFQNQQIGVQAFGSGTLSYDWQNGSNGVYADVVNDSRISGAATATLVISNLALTDTADYIVIVTNNSGSVTSSVSHLTVNPVLGPATNITTTVVSAAGNDWDAASTWSINGNLQTDGATLLSEEYSSGPGQGSTFTIQAAGGIRTPAFNNPNSPTTSTFPGDVLIVQGNGTYDPGQTGAAGNIRIKGGNPATVNFKKLVLAGGQLSSILNSGWPAIISGGEVNVTATSVIWASDDTNPRSINILSTLTGNANIVYHAYNTLTTFQSGSSASLNIANANNTYSGTWDVQFGALIGGAPNALGTNSITVEAQGALQTTYDINNTNANLVINGRMFLTQNDTFRTVSINGTTLSAGTHPFSELSANYPASFPATWTALNGATGAATGSGSITVLVGASNPGTIQIGGGGPTGLQLTWTNSSTLLLSATNLSGPWVTNVGAVSPYSVTNDTSQKFFKLLGQ